MYRNKTIACVVLNYNDYEQTSDFILSTADISCLDTLIVVDNCSTDDSFSKLLSYAEGKIRVYKTERNGGYGYGNNYGVKIAKKLLNADYTIISNPDVKFDEDLVFSIVDAFIEDDSVAIVSSMQKNGYSGQIINNCGWRVPTFGDYLSASLIVINKFTSRNRYCQIESEKKSQYVGCVPGAFLAVDTERFLKVGGYDENVFLFCEESILGFRMRDSGFKTTLLTDKYYNHFHSTSLKKSIPKEINRHKMVLNSRRIYIDKYLHVSRLKRLLASVVFSVSVIEYRILYVIKK